MKNKKTIGIIGFGRFGEIVAQYLSPDFAIKIFDTKNKRKEAKKYRVGWASLVDVCKQDIIILSVPISSLELVLKRIKSLVKDSALVIDVCTVKEHPVSLMKRILPKKVRILATHPMFGPDSAAQSLKGSKIVLCPVRISRNAYAGIRTYLRKKGLTIIEVTPREHDRQIAKSLVFTQFIGRSLMAFGAKKMQIDTEGYQRLMHILGVVKNDTWQLFHDMNMYNSYAANIRKKFIESAKKIDRRLE